MSPQEDEVRDRLLLDHDGLTHLVEEVLDAFEAKDPPTVTATWARFDAQLLRHLDAEERYLIPALFRANPRVARCLLEEHRHLRQRLTELGTEIDLHFLRPSAARAFIDELAAHAKHEDELLYRWSDEHVDERERRSLLGGILDEASSRIAIA